MESKRPKKKRVSPRESTPAADTADRAIQDATLALSEAVARLSESIKSSAETAADSATRRGIQAATSTLDGITQKLTATKKSSVVKEDVLKAAAQAFAERGFDGVSVDEIATAAGYTKGAVYSRFTSKTELFLDVLDSRIRPCNMPEQSLQASTAADEDPDLRLQLVLEAISFGLRHEAHRESVANMLSESLIALTQELDPARKSDPKLATGISPSAILALSAATMLPALQNLGIVGVQGISATELIPPPK